MRHRNLAETGRLIVYVLDAACASADPARNPAGRICCLFDLAGGLWFQATNQSSTNQSLLQTVDWSLVLPV